jgi:hypothetical protein
MNPRPAPARLPLSLAALVLVAFALSGLMTGVLARGFAGDLTINQTPPTATVASVRTPTRPRATATPIHSPTAQIIDQQAAAAFRAIYLTAASDGSCSIARNQTTFASGTLVTINLCLAQSAPPGTVTVALRQSGVTQTTVIPDLQAKPNHWYSQSIRIPTPGAYDMLVTFNGATAADPTFTVS